MACYHPLKAFPIGLTENGKTKYKIAPYKTDHVERNGDKWFNVPAGVQVGDKSIQEVYDFVEIPCGRCVGCRLAYSRQWADRCLLELQYHECSYFLTLTYDDEHLTKNQSVDYDTGEVREVATLVKSDFQKFMKRLRKNYKYDNELRFYMCGEYGTRTKRPHYHVIVFGLKLDDLVYHSKSGSGFPIYNSEFVSKCWQHQGFVTVQDVTWETCAYTARYVMKKLNEDLNFIYSDLNITPEFTLMSRRPGIARQFYDDNKTRIYEYDNIFVSTSKGGKALRPPRYYDRLFDIDYPSDYAKLKAKRKSLAENSTRIKLQSFSGSYEDMLAVEEEIKLNRLKALPRKEI